MADWQTHRQPRRGKDDLVTLTREVSADENLSAVLGEALDRLEDHAEAPPPDFDHLDCVVRVDAGEVTLYPGKDCDKGRVETLCVSLYLPDVERRLGELFDEDEAAFEAESVSVQSNVKQALRRAVHDRPTRGRFAYVHFGDADEHPRQYERIDWPSQAAH